MRMGPRVTQRTQFSKEGVNPTTRSALSTLCNQSCPRRRSRPSNQASPSIVSYTNHCSILHPDRPLPHPWPLRGPCPRALLKLCHPPNFPNRGPLSTSLSKLSSLSSLMTTHARSALSPSPITPPMLTHTPHSEPSWSGGKVARGQHPCTATSLPPSR